MNAKAASPVREPPAVTRLGSLASLSEEETTRLRRGAAAGKLVALGREIAVEGAPAAPPVIVLSGWAYRMRQLPDGRVQVLGLLLPGDLIEHGAHPAPLVPATIVCATPVMICTAPAAEAGSALAQAYAVCDALEKSYLFRQIVRLGRMSAYERTVDWLLEVNERLALAGIAEGDRFPLPLTQNLISDLLGLTTVHLNRTLQALRREGMIQISRGQAHLCERERMAEIVDLQPTRVSRQQRG